MSDRFWARLTIGGPWPGPMSELNLRRLIDDMSDNGEIFSGYHGLIQMDNSEARYGGFEDLEGWLGEVRIPYDRQSSGYGEYDPQIVFSRATHDFSEFLCNQHGEPMISIQEIESVLKLYDTKKVFSAATLVEKLREVFPSIPPKLEPLPRVIYDRICHELDVFPDDRDRSLEGENET